MTPRLLRSWRSRSRRGKGRTIPSPAVPDPEGPSGPFSWDRPVVHGRGSQLWLFCLALLAVGGWSLALPVSQTNTASLLIKDGLLIDGTGAPRRRADVRLQGDQIRQIGTLSPRPGETVIDARGRAVAPGFIDTHSHADRGFPKPATTESDIRQGITTAIVGQDGGSNLPLAAFFNQMKAKPTALNFASFVGHGAVRRQVMGADFKRSATDE